MNQHDAKPLNEFELRIWCERRKNDGEQNRKELIMPNENINEIEICAVGLTKREYFAAMAMQGVLASWNNPVCELDPIAVAARAVSIADALLHKIKESDGKQC